MPVPRKRKHARSGRGELSVDQSEYLRFGTCLDPDKQGEGCWIEPTMKYQPREWIPFADEPAMRAAWNKHKKELSEEVKEVTHDIIYNREGADNA